ncbi:MAG: DNA polymerase III subunit alpha [Patescibacteria group bacterium]
MNDGPQAQSGVQRSPIPELRATSYERRATSNERRATSNEQRATSNELRAAGFVHLHVHSEYSLLDGCARIPALVETARELGFLSLALTDHGAVYGTVPFVKAMRAAGLRPILGAEVYLVDAYGPPPRPAQPYHLVLLSETEEGYVHLMELVTCAHLDHFHKKPLLTLEEIAPRARGLIALSGCLRGQIPRLLAAGDPAGARAALGACGEIFGRGNFYVEMQRHGLEEEDRVNALLAELARAEGYGLAATNDVHYLGREEAANHDLLLAVQTLALVEQENRLRLAAPEYYLKSGHEMAALFADLPEALRNTGLIAERCRFELELGKRRIPVFPTPGGVSEGAYLRLLCEEGLARLYPGAGPEVRARLEHELGVIDRLGFAGYFLMVWEIVAYARREGIPVGPGRGSSVGSLVAYLLGITGVDPLAHGLLFERFLNPERADPPDIDVDLCHRGRARVLAHIRERYGRDRVAHLAAFNTLRPRAAVRDAGRALGAAYDKLDRLAKAIPFASPDLDTAMRESAELRRLVASDPDCGRVVAAARGIEGLPRHLTQHAAGVVVAAEPLTRYVALEEAGEGEIVAQADMNAVEDLGLLKIDLLGLRYLTVIEDTLAFLRREGIELAAGDIPPDDPAAMAAMAQGRTAGTFQLESGGMRRLLGRYRPETIADVALILALYRPGPLGSGMVESLIARRHGREAVVHLHPAIAGVLGDTYGVIVYQEQVMEVASALAGYSPGRADLLRKAVSKRRPEILAGEREAFTAGAERRGVPGDVAGAVFDLIAEFGHYGFAKAHSAAYALTSYRTVYLKTHYPLAYHAALLSLNLGDGGRFPAYLSETRRLGIRLLLPSINRSEAGFCPEGGAIRAGLCLVRDLGAQGVAAILRERRRGGFRSLGDFCLRLRGRGVSARAIANLIRAGAFDEFGPRAAQLLELHTVWTKGRGRAKARPPGQLALFGGKELEPAAPAYPAMPEYGEDVRREMEREVLGFYLTSHPLERCRAMLEGVAVTEIESLEEDDGACEVILCGLAGGIRGHRTRQGKRMLFANLEDLTGQVELVFFPAALERYGHLLQGGEPLVVWGRPDRGGDRASVRVDRVRRLADLGRDENAVYGSPKI